MLFPGGSAGKKLACQDSRYKRHSFDPWVGRIPWRRNGNSLEFSCLENSVARGAWWATVHAVTESGTWISVRARTHTPKRLGLNIFKENYELKIIYLYMYTSYLHITGQWTYLCTLSCPEGTTPTLATFTTFWRITEEAKFCGAAIIVVEVSFIPESMPVKAEGGSLLLISFWKLH